VAKSKVIRLNLDTTAELELGYKQENAIFSKRCHMILLKSESKTSQEIANLLLTNPISVNKWVNRYKAQGIEGLRTKPGQGRKRILDGHSDEAKVRAVVQTERQRLKFVKEQLEQDLNKSFSMKTL
jgi:transposase